VAAIAVAPIGRDSDQDGVDNLSDRCPTTNAGIAVDATGCALFSGVIEGVNFSPNSALLTNSALARLRVVVATLKQYPNARFMLSAHTDSQGSEANNQALSARRAKAVAKYFINEGIDKSRFTAKAFGENQPIKTNSTVEGRRANRRVELHIIR
jgi:OOP family OmpA-OmpF porin